MAGKNKNNDEPVTSNPADVSRDESKQHVTPQPMPAWKADYLREYFSSDKDRLSCDGTRGVENSSAERRTTNNVLQT